MGPTWPGGRYRFPPARWLSCELLVFGAEPYLLAAVEDMLREAHGRAEDSRWSAISFLGGFALFLVVSGALG
jgi:zinc transporter, ZIP family